MDIKELLTAVPRFIRQTCWRFFVVENPPSKWSRAGIEPTTPANDAERFWGESICET